MWCQFMDAAQTPVLVVETFRANSSELTSFATAIAEPVSLQSRIHEYTITPYSLMSASALGYTAQRVIEGLEAYCHDGQAVQPEVVAYVKKFFESYGRLALVLHPAMGYVVESAEKDLLQGVVVDKALAGSGTVEAMPSGTSFFVRVPQDKLHLVKTSVVETSGYSLSQQYAFAEDTALPRIPISLKATTSLRPYQQAAIGRFSQNGRAHSGIVVLPCGAGKTLVGVTAMCCVGRPTVIVCSSAVSVEQWRRQMYEFCVSTDPEHTSFDRGGLVCAFISKGKDFVRPHTAVVITTYAMLTAAGRRSEKSAKLMSALTSRQWGLLVLDEVHSLPADIFKNIITTISAKCLLGLTATLLREDNKVTDLTHLVGPKLFEGTWWDLVADRYLAEVKCMQVRCAMTSEFEQEYQRAVSKPQLRIALAASNPNKLRECFVICQRHAARGDKIMVFSDDLLTLRVAATLLKCPLVCGSTPHRDRMRLLSEFQHSSMSNVLCISRVGDTSINLPAATVLVQLCCHGGSRRQEVQRLGRLLRPKPGNPTAYFYSLVTPKTHEVAFAQRRLGHLVEQGYAYRVGNAEVDLSETEYHGLKLPYCTVKDRAELLSKIVSQWEDVFTEETLEDTALLEDAVPEREGEEGRDAPDGRDDDDDEAARDRSALLRHGVLSRVSLGNVQKIFSEYAIGGTNSTAKTDDRDGEYTVGRQILDDEYNAMFADFDLEFQ